MHKRHRKAVILDNLIPLSISFIKQAFDLKCAGKQSKELILYAFNPVTRTKASQATILVTLILETHGYDYLDLQYQYNGMDVQQQVGIIVKRDNLKKGNLFYFRCPISGEQKRKLFLHEGKFVSKQKIDNAYYQSQVRSRKQRNQMKGIRQVIKAQKLFQKAQEGYFMKFYNGEPTRRYIKTLMAVEDLKEAW